MVKVKYNWLNGAKLPDHSAKKLKVLREYVADYIRIRCQIPQQRVFRLAFVDGFAGGGRYSEGEPGSPLVFLQEVIKATQEINLKRSAEGFAALEIQCLCLVNELDSEVLGMLWQELQPLKVEANQTPNLSLVLEKMNLPFEEAYPAMKTRLQASNINSVLFNLDQCGHSLVDSSTIRDIMQSFGSPEVFYTVAIEAFLAFLQKENSKRLALQFASFGGNMKTIQSTQLTDQKWLGEAEKLVFAALRDCAPHLSPFSIHNPDGWQYWLVHFVKSHKGREAFNNVLHRNSNMQAHYGRSGLRMLAYKPEEEQNLFLFDKAGRERSIVELQSDIPDLIAKNGDSLIMGEFLEQVYSQTPAHGDDIRASIIKHPDIEVVTPRSGIRQKAGQIQLDDLIRLKAQHSFWSMFGKDKK
jgi:three-Cys-motif partner protein